VPKTSQIENLVITEESGVAKGIRRITAVTGSEAREATDVAVELDTRLSLLATTPTVNLAELKALTLASFQLLCQCCWTTTLATQEVTEANISVIKKSEFKQRLTVLRKSVQKRLKDSQIEYLETVGLLVFYFSSDDHISRV
jgi:alanyl-tRNA synthetase